MSPTQLAALSIALLTRPTLASPPAPTAERAGAADMEPDPVERWSSGTSGGPSVEGPERASGFVVSATLGLQMSVLFPIPSGELSLALGGVLPLAPRRPGHWLALTYRLTGAYGGADAITLWGDSLSAHFAHRHHLAFIGVAGRRSRLAYGTSVGVAVFTGGVRAAHGHSLRNAVAPEIEVRLGRAFAVSPVGARCIVGGQLRLSGLVPFPAPSIGVFVGGYFGNGLTL